MTKVNPKFIEAKQKRLDEKEKIFVGKLNYKNMTLAQLHDKIMEKAEAVHNAYKDSSDKKLKKELCDLSNMSGFLWERLGEK